jgi:hypothetical protein
MTNGVTTYLAVVFALAAPAFAQERFDSADAAAQVLVDSVARHDSARMAAIFGPRGNTILTSGNPTQDHTEQSEFSWRGVLALMKWMRWKSAPVM